MTLSNAAERVFDVRVIEDLAYVSDNAANPRRCGRAALSLTMSSLRVFWRSCGSTLGCPPQCEHRPVVAPPGRGVSSV